MLRRVPAIAALALPLILLGCGGGGGDDLVRYEVKAGELSFEFDEPQDSGLPVPDALLIVQPDGQATYEFADQPEIEFRLSDADLSELESLVDAIDFEEARAELSGPTEEGLPAMSVTHDGTTVDLGDKFIEINSGEGPAVADQMSDLLDELETLIGNAPGVEQAVEKHFGVPRNDNSGTDSCPNLRLGGKLVAFRITVKGVICAEAETIVVVALKDSPPPGWSCEAKLTHTTCVNGRKRIGFINKKTQRPTAGKSGVDRPLKLDVIGAIEIAET